MVKAARKRVELIQSQRIVPGGTSSGDRSDEPSQGVEQKKLNVARFGCRKMKYEPVPERIGKGRYQADAFGKRAPGGPRMRPVA